MSKIIEIIRAIREADGSKAKQAILNENTGNELFKNFLKATYDPAISYYMTELPKIADNPFTENIPFGQDTIDFFLNKLATRQISGNAAKQAVTNHVYDLDADGQELAQLLLDRSIGANVGDTMVLNAFPDLYFIPPYMRCSLMDEKIHEHFSSLEWFYVQEKLDMSYASVEANESGNKAFTRQGNTYPQWFADRLASSLQNGFVKLGEVCVFKDGEILTRKAGNGILNSIQQGAKPEDVADYEFRHVCWDLLTVNEFKAGRSDVPYQTRFTTLIDVLPHNEIVKHYTVNSLEQANKIAKTYTRQGKEGVVIKDPASPWFDGTSKYNVKMKVVFEAEYRITGSYEGKGNLKGTLGGIEIASEDDILESNCGSGFDYKDRDALWAIRDKLAGMIVTVKANEVIISKKKGAKPSLNLPIFAEVRYDKTVADTYDRILAQQDAARGLSDVLDAEDE